jgi:general secretion pathway protein H
MVRVTGHGRLPRRSGGGGFTLIEIMMVLVVMGLVVGLGMRGFRALAKSDLRTSSARLAGAVRILFDRASTTGKHHRLVIDLADGHYWAEVSDDRFYVPHEAETALEARRREEAEAADDQERQRRDEEAQPGAAASSGALPSGSSFDYSKLDVGDFRPKRARFAAFKEAALKPVALKNVKVRSVYTPRLSEPVTSGRAYVYFFPLGQTEPAIITLSDESGDNVYSLVVHPITGRVLVYNHEVKPPVGDQFDDEGHRVAR